MRVWHYLYFRSESVGRRVARDLNADGYGVECRVSPPICLVRANHLVADQEALEAVAADLQRVSSREGGEYDGWEREASSLSAWVPEDAKPR
ncbi:MAG: ribonuclease E inhibitor RraB [Candidatus Dormibacteria bacterium]